MTERTKNMTTIAELRKKAQERFPGFPIEFEDGTSIRLRSNVELEDETLMEFKNRATRIGEAEKNPDMEVSEFKAELVETLALVADNTGLAKTQLGGESLAMLTVILEEYFGMLQTSAQDVDAPKSEDAPKTGPKPRTRSRR